LYKALGGGWEIRCPGFESHGAVSQPPEAAEIVPLPEATAPPLVPSSDRSFDLPAEAMPELPTNEENQESKPTEPQYSEKPDDL
jgi:hypothetical protein